MISRYTHKKLTWIDLESPTPEEVRSVMEEFKIHQLVANELLSPTIRPKVDLYNDFIYLILHFPYFVHGHGKKPEQEIDFIIGKNFLITTHYETIDTVHEFSKVFEVNSIIDKSNLGNHAGFLAFYLIRELYKSLSHELESINRLLLKVEHDIFEGREKMMVYEISKLNRSLLGFNHSLNAHQNILSSFEAAGTQFFGEGLSYYLRALTGEYYKVANMIEGNKEILLELRETNDSLLSTKTNEVMKILTIMAFVTFPLSLIAAIFGMNTAYLPIVGINGDFWIITGGMLTAMILFFAFFKYKKWI